MNNKIILTSTIGPEQEFKKTDNLEIGFFYYGNPKLNQENEDSLGLSINKNSFFGVVSDGAGGHPKGEEASKIAVEHLIENQKDIHESYENLRLIEEINQKILNLKVGARATLMAFSIFENKLRSFSVGDSEILVLDTKGREVYANIPDTPSSYKVEAGLIDQIESLDEPDRHVVTNLLGDKKIRVECLLELELKRGYTVIVGSDGLFDNVTHDSIKEFYQDKSSEDLFNYLVNLCTMQDENNWRKHDDTSFILVKYTS